MTTLRHSNILHELIDIAHELLDSGDEINGNAILERARQLKESTLLGQLPEGFVLYDLQNFLNHLNIDYCIIGGLAMLVHGTPRSTEDIDVLVSKIPPNEITSNIEEMRKFNFYKTQSRTGTHMVLDHRKSGMCELLLADDELRRWALQTSSERHVLGATIKVVNAIGLVALKVRAMSNKPSRASKDVPDIVSVVMKSKPNLEELHGIITDNELLLLNSVLPLKYQF
jgi:hypothetical protein